MYPLIPLASGRTPTWLPYACILAELPNSRSQLLNTRTCADDDEVAQTAATMSATDKRSTRMPVLRAQSETLIAARTAPRETTRRAGTLRLIGLLHRFCSGAPYCSRSMERVRILKEPTLTLLRTGSYRVFAMSLADFILPACSWKMGAVRLFLWCPRSGPLGLRLASRSV